MVIGHMNNGAGDMAIGIMDFHRPVTILVGKQAEAAFGISMPAYGRLVRSAWREGHRFRKRHWRPIDKAELHGHRTGGKNASLHAVAHGRRGAGAEQD